MSHSGWSGARRAGQDGPVHTDPVACARAVRSRDPRFDGWFFTAVRTTGIYCRPSCPAMTPKAANMEFYPSAAAALADGGDHVAARLWLTDLRGWGDPDAFPVGDLGVRRGTQRLGLPDDPDSLSRRSRRWQPWRACATAHLWAATDHEINHLPGEPR